MQPSFIWFEDHNVDVIAITLAEFKALPSKMRIIDCPDVQFAANERKELAMIRIAPGRMHPTLPEVVSIAVTKLYGPEFAEELRESYAYCWAVTGSPKA